MTSIVKAAEAAAGVPVITQRFSPDVFGPNGLDYQNESANFDLSRIGIDIIEHGPIKISDCKPGEHCHEKPHESKRCAVGDWTTVHWVGSLTDGRMITSSRDEEGGLPRTFALGAAEAFKCWDVAIPQLKQGDKAKVSCPADYVYGSAFTPAPLGGEPVPLNSDVNFELEVVECNRTPEFTEQIKQPKTTTLQPEQCFYLHLEKSVDTAYDLVLSTDDEDWGWWWPAKYAKIEQKVVDDPNQMWIQKEDGSIHNAADPTYYLENDFGHVMVADIKNKKRKEINAHKDFPKEKRKWFFDSVEHTLTTDIDSVQSELAIKGQPQNFAYAEIAPSSFMVGQNENKSKWKFEYCWNKNYGPHGDAYYGR